jgi:DNA repair exonuclease SbcCD ATPase subunit
MKHFYTLIKNIELFSWSKSNKQDVLLETVDNFAKIFLLKQSWEHLIIECEQLRQEIEKRGHEIETHLNTVNQLKQQVERLESERNQFRSESDQLRREKETLITSEKNLIQRVEKLEAQCKQLYFPFHCFVSSLPTPLFNCFDDSTLSHEMSFDEIKALEVRLETLLKDARYLKVSLYFCPLHLCTFDVFQWSSTKSNCVGKETH